MPKTIIINDTIINKGILNEAIEFSQLPKHIRIDVLRNKTPLSNNLCFPYENYLERALSLTYGQVVNSETDNITLSNKISKIKRDCQKIEEPFKNNLEILASNCVSDIFQIPADKIDFSVTLVDGIDQSKTDIPFGPNEEMPDNLVSIDDFDIISKEVSKRKIINCLNAGAARYFSNILLCDLISNLDEINPHLYDLYVDYLKIGDTLLFITPEDLSEHNKKLTGKVIVTLGNDERKNQLEAEGVILPVLLYETIKGFFEIFTSHGIPSDPQIAEAVVSKCDYLLAEPWYMRVGPFIWNAFNNILKDIKYNKRPELLPYILMKISQLEADKFIRLMKEILGGTQKAKRVMGRICEYAEKRLEKDNFYDKLSNQNKQNDFLLNDSIE